MHIYVHLNNDYVNTDVFLVSNVSVLTKLKVDIVPDFQTSAYPVHIRRPWDTVDEGGEQVDGFKRLNGIDRFYDVVFFSKIMLFFTMQQSA